LDNLGMLLNSEPYTMTQRVDNFIPRVGLMCIDVTRNVIRLYYVRL